MNSANHILQGRQALEDRAEIIDTILGFFYAMDTKNWTTLHDCLTDQIDVDYTAFRSEARQIMNVNTYVGKRADNLKNLHTQHISTNHLVSLEANRAQCTSCFLIHRLDPARTNNNTYDTAGHYIHGLIRTPHGWRIDHIKQTVLWSRGNQNIHGGLRKH